MSLQTRLAALVSAVGADIKADRARLTSLETQGIPVATPTVAAKVTHDANQTFASGGATNVLAFNTVIRDDAGMWVSGANSRLTAPSAGWYHIRAASYFGGVSADVTRQLCLRKNGTTFLSTTIQDNSAAAYDTEQEVSADEYLNAGDYVEVVFFFSGAAETASTLAGGRSPSFSMARIPGANAVLLGLQTPADSLQPGVVGAADLGQYQAATSSSMFIEAGVIWAFVGSVLTRFVVPRTTVSGFSATGAGLFRFDKVVFDPADGLVKRVAGTAAASGVTMANRLNEGPTPTNGIVLYDLVVTPTGISTGSGNLRNRKPWARGAYLRGSRTSGNLTASSTTFTALDTTNLRFRMECSGAPLRLSIHAFGGRSIANGRWDIGWLMDAASLAGLGVANARLFAVDNTNAGAYSVVQTIVPPAGSHLFDIAAAVGDAGGGTATIYGSATSPLQWSIEELIRQNASNGSA